MNITEFDNYILYMDNHLLVVNKPAGLLVQGDQTGDLTLLEQSKVFLKEKFDKKGNVYLGLVQRIDRPVSGIVVFARTSKAAGRLSEAIRQRHIRKTYIALVQGVPNQQDKLIDYLDRNGVTSIIADSDTGKKAELSYKRLDSKKNVSLLEIDLHTGRHHQIRVQFSSRGFPILGDFRYGSKTRFGNKALALHASRLSLQHPVSKEWMTFKSYPDSSYWPIDSECKEILFK